MFCLSYRRTFTLEKQRKCVRYQRVITVSQRIQRKTMENEIIISLCFVEGVCQNAKSMIPSERRVTKGEYAYCYDQHIYRK